MLSSAMKSSFFTNISRLAYPHLNLGKQILENDGIKRISIYQVRHLNFHEYQSKRLLQENGIAVQQFKVVDNQTKISHMLKNFKPEEYVLKAQVLAGGRGKGYFKNSNLQGGVKLTRDINEAASIIETMLNDRLVTKQTTEDGELVEKVMVAEAVTLEKELYFAIVLDPSYDLGMLLICSADGGMDIEEISKKDKKRVLKFSLPIDFELDRDIFKKFIVDSYNLHFHDLDIIEQCVDQIEKLIKLFKKVDATMIEINPLGVTDKRQVICVDAKFKFDDNARFRQSWLKSYEQEIKSTSEKDIREETAKKHSLNFIGLDGSVGCLVNGAGLAMATMDILNLHGGKPANFLDVGGSANAMQIFEALKIIVSDQNVKSIFVNIFGGIMRCDLVAAGLLLAVNKLQIQTPIVARLQGAKVEEAKKIIKDSDTDIIMIDDLEKAAQLAADLSKFGYIR